MLHPQGVGQYLNAIHAVLDQEEEETTPHTYELFGKFIAHQGLSLPSVGDKCSLCSDIEYSMRGGVTAVESLFAAVSAGT